MTQDSLSTEDLLRDHAWLQNLARSLCRDTHAAADLTQDTWAAALQRPGGFPGRRWLSRVLRNLAVDRYRAEARRQARQDADTHPEALPGQEHLVERIEAQRLLAATMLELDEPGRSILVLRYQEGQSPAQIARSLDLAPGTVRSRLSRALLQLRGLMARRMGVRDQDLHKALAPLTGLPGLWQTQGAASKTLLWSSSMSIKITGLCAVACLSLFVWRPWQETAAEADDPRSSAPAAAALEAVARTPAASPASQRRSLASFASFPKTPGWWLEGILESSEGQLLTGARVRVWDRSGKQSTPLHTSSDPRGRIELDLGGLFRHPDFLLRGLRLEIDHPEHLPVMAEFGVDREHRRRGQIGERVSFRFRQVLEAADSRCAGVVTGPEGQPLAGALVALLPPQQQDFIMRMPISWQRSDAQGRFSLRARSEQPYLCCAWVPPTRESNGTLLLPKSQEITLREGSQKQIALQLQPSSRFPGQLEYEAAQFRGLRLLIRGELLHSSVFEEVEEEEITETEETHTDLVEEDHEVSTSLFEVLEPRFADLDRPAHTVSPYTVLRRAPDELGFNLVWVGKGFRFQNIWAEVVAGGHFAFQGIKQDSMHALTGIELWRGQQRVEIRNPLGPSLQLEAGAVRMTPTTRHISCKLRGNLQLVDVVAAAGWTTFRPTGSGWVEFSAADAGGQDHLIRLSGLEPGVLGIATPKPLTGVLKFEGQGLQPGKLSFGKGSTPQLRLQEPKKSGSLHLRLEGDPEHRIELCFLQLKRLPAQGKPESLTGHRGRVRRRFAPNLRFDGFEPGRYRATLWPQPHPQLVDLQCMHLRAEFEFEIFANQPCHVEVRLQPAGRIEILSAKHLLEQLNLPTDKIHALRLVDATGGPVPISLTSPGHPRNPMRRRPVKIGGSRHLGHSAMLPLLPPGAYRLQVGDQTHRLSVQAGRVTELGQPSPR